MRKGADLEGGKDISILEEAFTITDGARQQDYDSAEPNHKRIADGWNWYLGARRDPAAPISPQDASHMMIVLKLARAAFKPTRDGYVDMAGYARCSARIAKLEK